MTAEQTDKQTSELLTLTQTVVNSLI